MLHPRLRQSLIVVTFSLATAGVAAAQPQPAEEQEVPVVPAFVPYHFFAEVTGNWGLQLGVQSYVPAGNAVESKQPLTNGYGFGATAGWALTHDIAILLDYAHGQADSRNGDVMGALSSINGSITYDTLALGGRLARWLGPGRLYGQLGLGILFPTSTEIRYEYAPTLSVIGISGVGTEREHYNAGIGGLAEFGYNVPIISGLYVGAALRLQTFETSNDGRTTSLDNFVVDFSMPQAVTADIHHGTTSAATPTNYSVQDARLHIALGYDF